MLHRVYATAAAGAAMIDGSPRRNSIMSTVSESLFSRQFTSADGHVHRFLIAPHGAAGWELREERDNRLVRRVCYTDWHRVERARTVIELQASTLRETGWVES